MKATDRHLLKVLKEADEVVDGLLTVEKFNELDNGVTFELIRSRFGGWNAAKEKANIEQYDRDGIEYTDEECIDALQLAATKLDGSPSFNKYNDLGIEPSCQTIKERFGGWNAAKEVADV